MNTNEQQSRTFNPNEHLRQIKSGQGFQDYLDVNWRLVWFREKYPQGRIVTEEIVVDLDREVEEEKFEWNAEKRRSEKVIKRAHGYARYRAIVEDGLGGIATGTKTENAASFPDFCEKAETGAIGRALASLGFGTQFAPDLNEEHRIVDSPIEPRTSSGAPNGNGNANSNKETNGSQGAPRPQQNGNGQVKPAGNGNRPAPENGTAESDDTDKITAEQISAIRKLSEHLHKTPPADLQTLSSIEARKTIQQLSAEYKESKQQQKAS